MVELKRQYEVLTLLLVVLACMLILCRRCGCAALIAGAAVGTYCLGSGQENKRMDIQKASTNKTCRAQNVYASHPLGNVAKPISPPKQMNGSSARFRQEVNDRRAQAQTELKRKLDRVEDIMDRGTIDRAKLDAATRAAAIPVYGPPVNSDVCQTVEANKGTMEGWETGYMKNTPDCKMEQRVAQTATDSLIGAKKRLEPIVSPGTCCQEADLCPLESQWKGTYIGCPSTFVDAQKCMLIKRDPQLWHADLNPLLEERMMLQGAEWNPYEHFDARQNHLQFLAKDLAYQKDEYTRPIHDLKEAYCFATELRGEPDSVNW